MTLASRSSSCHKLHSKEDLTVALTHVLAVTCNVKLWYHTEHFVKVVAGLLPYLSLKKIDKNFSEILSSMPLSIRNVDLYPYSGIVPLTTIASHLPDVSTMVIRPHGTTYFYEALPITDVPDWNKMANLTTVSFDSISFRELFFPIMF